MLSERGNLFADLPDARGEEIFTQLLARPGIRIERIVSQGQSTPADAPMAQDSDEWVLLIAGAARLKLGDAPEVRLAPGDHLWIPAGQPHWVTWTPEDRATLWLAVHLE